jgi:hypothetical protein
MPTASRPPRGRDSIDLIDLIDNPRNVDSGAVADIAPIDIGEIFRVGGGRDPINAAAPPSEQWEAVPNRRHNREVTGGVPYGQQR